MKSKYFFIAVILMINLSLFAQDHKREEKFFIFFDNVLSYSSIDSDCQTFQKQIKNAFLLTLNKNLDWLKSKVQSQVEFNEFMTDYFDYFIKIHPQLVLRLSNCIDFPKDETSGFSQKNNIYENEFTIDIIRSFLLDNENYFRNLELNRKSVADSLRKEFIEWNPESIEISDNPVSVKSGKYYTMYNGQVHSIIIREEYFQKEILIKTQDTTNYAIKWLNNYEYEMKKIVKNPNYVFPDDLETMICRITKVNNESYSGIIKIADDFIGFKVYKK